MMFSSWLRRRGGVWGTSNARGDRASRPRLELLEDRTVPSAFLVKDINTNTAGSSPSNLLNVNGTLYFSATDNDGSAGLWKSDGSAAGTMLVKEFPAGLENFANVNGELFLDMASNQSGGPVQVWKSDGTIAGTALVKDFTGQGFFTLPNGSNGSATCGIAFKNQLYFVLADPTDSQSTLWKSDGTANGTVQVDPGAFALSPFGADLTPFGGQLYFAASDPVNGAKLWKTDGADANTQIADADIPNLFADALSVANGSLYFFAAHDSTLQTTDLIQSDGAHSTIIQTGFSNFGEEEIAGAGGKLFFIAAPSTDFFNTGLWTYDGITVRELQPANVSPFGFQPFFLHAVNGRVVFNGSSAVHTSFGDAIWASDGTDAGTVEITPAGFEFGILSNGETALSNNNLDFGAFGAGGSQLWQTDGTASGTTLIATINPPSPFANSPGGLTFAGGRLFFNATDGPHGNELWKSNGAAAGTQLVKDINTNTLSSLPSFLTDANGTLFFTADDSPAGGVGNPGPEIWKSDGSAAGTQLVGTPATSAGAFPALLTNVNGTVFFTEINGPPQLWTVSASAGPQLVMDFSKPNDFVSGPDNLTAVANELFFTITDNNTGEQDLWESNGTTAGTRLVQTNVIVAAGSGVAANGKFFFVGVDPNTFAFQLWVSDGTTTHIVDTNHPGSNVTGLANVNGTLYYFDQGANFNDLTFWKTDGTTATQIADFSVGTDFVSAFPPIEINGIAYFFVEDSTTGAGELWASNGMSAGTVLVAPASPDVAFNNQGNAIADAVAVNGRLFFTATDPVAGEQLWVSDGTTACTHVVTAITAGKDVFGSPEAFNLTAFNGKLFFTQSDAAHGEELWQSDGTAAGTFLVQNINPGPAGSAPTFLTPSNGTLFFSATDQAHGNELWAYYPATHLKITAASTVATPGSPFEITITALDKNNQVDTSYTGKVHFTSSDGSALLPLNYTFTPADQGVHSYTLILRKPGSPTQTITATDTSNGSIVGNITLTVPKDVSALVHVVATPPHHKSRDGLFDSQLILHDISEDAIRGPIQIVLFGLPPGVTLVNAGLDGDSLTIGETASGDTIITLSHSLLTRGKALRIDLEFSDPLVLPIDFLTRIYADNCDAEAFSRRDPACGTGLENRDRD